MSGAIDVKHEAEVQEELDAMMKSLKMQPNIRKMAFSDQVKASQLGKIFDDATALSSVSEHDD